MEIKPAKASTRSSVRVFNIFDCCRSECWCLASDTGLLDAFCCELCEQGTACQDGTPRILHVRPAHPDAQVATAWDVKSYEYHHMYYEHVTNALKNDSASNTQLMMDNSIYLNLASKMVRYAAIRDESTSEDDGEELSVRALQSQHQSAARARDAVSACVKGCTILGRHEGDCKLLEIEDKKGLPLPASVAGAGATLQWRRTSFESKEELGAAQGAATLTALTSAVAQPAVPKLATPDAPEAIVVPLPDEAAAGDSTVHEPAQPVPAVPTVIEASMLPASADATIVELQAKLHTSVTYLQSILAADEDAPAVTQSELEPLTSNLNIAATMLCALRKSNKHDRFDAVITVNVRSALKAFTKTAAQVDKATTAAGHDDWSMETALRAAIQGADAMGDLVAHRRFAYKSWFSTKSILSDVGVMREAMHTLAECVKAIRVRPDTLALLGVQGCGKSSTILRLRLLLATITTISENLAGFKDLLQEYLEAVKLVPLADRAEGNYPLEVQALALRLQLQIFTAHEEFDGPSIRERSPICGWIYSLALVKQGLLSIDQFKRVCWHIANNGYMPAGIILIRETPLTCKTRAQGRTGRADEGASPIEYFTNLVDSHEIFLSMEVVQLRLRYFMAAKAPVMAHDKSDKDAVKAANTSLVALWGGPISKFIMEGIAITNGAD